MQINRDWTIIVNLVGSEGVSGVATHLPSKGEFINFRPLKSRTVSMHRNNTTADMPKRVQAALWREMDKVARQAGGI
jgi:hypothetical protein